MAQALTTRAETAERFVTIQAAGRAFAVPLARVRDAVALGTVVPVPFAPAKVRGMIRAGSAVATVIDLRVALGLPPKPPAPNEVGLTVEEGGQLYTLIVDTVDGVAPSGAAARPQIERLDLASVVGP